MKKIYLVLFVILSIFVFSCKDNLISDDLSSSQNSGAGQVKVFVKQSRLIGPELSDVSWDVKLQKSGENNTISGKNENGYYLFSGLSDGTYYITVSGKIDDVEKFTGSAKVILQQGQNLDVNVPVVASKPNNDTTTSTGFATITMDMSEELLSKMGEKVFFQAELVGADGIFYIASFFDEENQILLDNQQITFAYTDYSQTSPIQTTDIPTGYYYLTFSSLEQSGYTIKLKDNLVEIGDGLTTNIVLTQDDYEIVEYYSSILYVNNEGGETADGKTLSNPIAFSTITERNYADLIYLLSDVDFVYDTVTKNLYPNLGSFFVTISSFDSTVRTISANISNYSSSITLGYGTTLKNIKLSGINAFSFESLNIDETVILDTPIAKNLESNTDSTVLMSKSSNLRIGQNFSGELGICLFPENWQLGDTVVTFENGKPNNANFYISESYDSQGNSLASKFYIDDNGKLAKYTDDFTSFAWTENTPHLVTKTQAKNKTMTTILNESSSISNFTGVSTYDHENNTWYFINNSADSSALYSVTNPKNYEGVVEASLFEIGDMSAELSNITAMDYDNGKLYFGYYFNGGYNFYSYDVAKEIFTTINWLSIPMTNANSSDLTSFMVKGNDFYIATTFTDTNQPEQVATHSAIWKYTLSEDTSDNGTFYNLIPAESYVSDEVEYPVPYYLTQYDNKLTINSSFPEGSTFRITDLYIDGTEVYGLLANYVEKINWESVSDDEENKSFMRGSVFKLITNSERVDGASDPIMNATQLGLRKSFPLTSDDLATAKQYFILPRKIVGVLNKKLVIVDDGMVPDSNDCNVDRFVLFDLASEISETIDVGTSFTTQASVSSNKFHTNNNPLFDAPQY